MQNQVPAQIPFTAPHFAQLKTKYAQLTAERAEVMKRLQTAREMGDLSENGAYKYAKFELGSIGRQLADLKYLLTHGFVVKKNPSPQKVEFGCTVKVIAKQKEVTYTIVSQYESNPKEGKLSMESPIGSALLHKKTGDEVPVETPAGVVLYTITDIF